MRPASRGLTEQEKNLIDAPKKSKKTVFANEMLCHVWANQSQESGRNAKNTLYFRGDEIYSYGQHFLAGKIYTNKDGSKFALVNSHNYSMATSGHLGDIRSALSGKMPYYIVPDVRVFNSPKNVEFVEARVLNRLSDIYNGRTKHYGDIKDTIDQIKEDVADANAVLKAMGAPLLVITDTELESIEEVIAAKIAYKAAKMNDPKRIEANKKAFLARLKPVFDFYATLTPEAKQEAINKFRNFETNSIDFNVPYNMRLDYRQQRKLTEYGIELPNVTGYTSNFELLRVDATNRIVETSRGAEVPLEHAIRALKLIKAGNASKIKIGHFETDEISDGIIKIGCHRIELNEAEAVLAPYITKLELLK